MGLVPLICNNEYGVVKLAPMLTLPLPVTVSLFEAFVFKYIFPFVPLAIKFISWLALVPNACIPSNFIPIPWLSFGCLNIAAYPLLSLEYTCNLISLVEPLIEPIVTTPLLAITNLSLPLAPSQFEFIRKAELFPCVYIDQPCDEVTLKESSALPLPVPEPPFRIQIILLWLAELVGLYTYKPIPPAIVAFAAVELWIISNLFVGLVIPIPIIPLLLIVIQLVVLVFNVPFNISKPYPVAPQSQ